MKQRERLPPEKVAELVSLYRAGDMVKVIAYRCGVSETTVDKYAAKAGLYRRRRKGHRRGFIKPRKSRAPDIRLRPITLCPQDGRAIFALDQLGYGHIVHAEPCGFYDDDAGEHRNDIEWWAAIPARPRRKTQIFKRISQEWR